MNFSELALIHPIEQAIAAAGYTEPTAIQYQVIPEVLAGKDVLGCAQTGTGKTAAFAIPILQQLSLAAVSGVGIRALILTPTRELALQIDESFASYGKYLNIRHTAVYGGVSQNKQVEALVRGVEVLTATPGRLQDLMQQGYIDLSKLNILVLDEADRMLDMGFVNDVKRIVAKVPAKRQTLLFSATMPAEIRQLAGSMLHSPVEISVTPVSSTAQRVQQSVCFVEKKEKANVLVHILQGSFGRTLVFTRTKHGADRLAKKLSRAGIDAAAIHGDKSQGARQRALDDFKTSRVRVLVATDIAARGIDIDNLPSVINFDLPEVPETYVHRIGRTGRAGMEGSAISFCDAEERADLKNIQKLIGFEVPVLDIELTTVSMN